MRRLIGCCVSSSGTGVLIFKAESLWVYTDMYERLYVVFLSVARPPLRPHTPITSQVPMQLGKGARGGRSVFMIFILFSFVYCAGIFKQSMGARNREGIELSYRPARLHSLVELVP
jgi:hypothetical protein